MTLFCPILKAHSVDCISLSSLVQNMFMAYILLSSIYYFVLKNTKSNNPMHVILKDYYVNNKYETLVVDMIYIGFIFSFTFMLYRIIYVDFIKRNIKITPYLLFFILFNIIIIVTNLLLSKVMNSKSISNKLTIKWSNLNGKIRSVMHNIIFLNTIAIIGFGIILAGYSNIIIPPIYTALAVKYLL
jgi:hypothetical protein